MTMASLKSDSPDLLTEDTDLIDHLIEIGRDATAILSVFVPDARPAVAQYLVRRGEVLRSEFRSDTEAEAFWAHVGEDAAIERANLGEHGMAQVPGKQWATT